MLCLLCHLELLSLEHVLRLLCFLVVQIKSEADKLAQRHLRQSLFHIVLICRACQVQHIADEATDMVVVDRIELVPGQNVCQESENLHVDVLGVIVGLLRCVLRVIERHDAISHAQVALLLGLILKLDHLLGHFCLEVE